MHACRLESWLACHHARLPPCWKAGAHACTHVGMGESWNATMQGCIPYRHGSRDGARSPRPPALTPCIQSCMHERQHSRPAGVPRGPGHAFPERMPARWKSSQQSRMLSCMHATIRDGQHGGFPPVSADRITPAALKLACMHESKPSGWPLRWHGPG